MIREQAFGEALNLDKLERLGRYNFVRIHKTLRVTPAMAAGVTEKLWSMEDIAELVEAATPKPDRPAAYKKRPAEISN